ncbi:hypothetical protein EV182_008895, partial [Spiromyces aspiralis]
TSTQAHGITVAARHSKYNGCPSRGDCAFFDDVLDQMMLNSLRPSLAYARLKEHGCGVLADQ